MLEVRGVTKTFGGVVAVEDASLETGPAKVTALIGPNGAGKTTLFNIITGFDRPDRGEIVLDGEQIAGRKPHQIARRGMVRTFQTPAGFPALTVWENLVVVGMESSKDGVWPAIAGRRSWGPAVAACDERATEVLSDLGLAHLADAPLSSLSPGDSKVVELARQLMLRPKLLLLDEPAAGVAPSQIDNVTQMIHRLRDQGLGILLIDHNLGFVLRVADHVYVMSEGAMVTSGPPAEVANDPRVIEMYLGEADAAA